MTERQFHPAPTVGTAAIARRQVPPQSARYRTNVGVAEVPGKAATVELTIMLPDSKITPKVQIALAPNEFRQLPLLADLGLDNVYNVRISVRVISGAGRVTAHGSLIDQLTTDPTYVPAQ